MNSGMQKLVIAAACLVVAVGGYFAVRAVWGQETPTEETSSVATSSETKQVVVIYEEAKEDFVSASITPKNGGPYTVEVNGDGWTVPELSGVTQYDTMVSTMVERLSRFEGYEKVADGVEDFSEYGLDEPDGSGVVNFEGGKSYTIDVGDETDDGYFYVTLRGSGTVYKATTGIRSYFITGKTTFISRSVFTGTQAGFQSIRLLHPGAEEPNDRELLLEQNLTEGTAEALNNTFSIQKPFYMIANESNMTDGLEDLCSIAASDVVTLTDETTDLSQYGLDNPQFTLEFTYQEEEDDEAQQITLYFGTLTEDNEYYVMREGVPLIYLLSKDICTYLDWTPRSISLDIPFQPMLSWIDHVTINVEGEEYRFYVQSDGTTASGVTFRGGELDFANFQRFYQVLISTGIVDYADKPEGAEPYLTITYTYRADKEKAEDVVKFYPINERRYFMETNGEGGFYVLATRIEKVVRDLDKVIHNETVTFTLN